MFEGPEKPVSFTIEGQIGKGGRKGGLGTFDEARHEQDNDEKTNPAGRWEAGGDGIIEASGGHGE